MRYCAFCKRLNPGQPVHCQFCGRTFGVRVCRRCREANPPETLCCRKCGSGELSESSGSVPFWLASIRLLFRIFPFILIMGIISNLGLLLSLLIILGLLALGFSLLPPVIRKLLKEISGYLWRKVIIGKEGRR